MGNTFVTPRWLVEESTAMVIDRVIPELGPAVRQGIAKMSDEELERFARDLGRALHPGCDDEDDD